MSQRTNAYRESFQEMSFEVSTNKKQKKGSNQFVLSSSMGRKQHAFPSTQRKILSYGVDKGLLMDQVTTPMKYDISRHKQTFFNGNQQVSSTSKHKQILIKLNQTQQRLIQSQKKYGQLFRKYESSCETIAQLTATQRDKVSVKQNQSLQQKKILQQWQMRCSLLERQNQQNVSSLRSKQEETLGLRRKLERVSVELRERSQEVQGKERQIERLWGQMREREEIVKRVEGELKGIKEVQGRSYERVIMTLKSEVQQLRLQLQSKEQQISRMLFNSNTTNNNQQSSSSQLLQQQLSRLHRQKLAVISSYESKLNELSQRHQQQFRLAQRQFGRKLEQEMARRREERIKLQEMELELRRERMVRYEQVQMIRGENVVLINQVQELRHINTQLQMQIENMLHESQHTIIKNITKSPQNNQYQLQQQQSLHELSSQLQCIKHSITSINTQLQHKAQLLSIATNQKDKLFEQIHSLQQQIKHQSSQQLQISKQFKSQIDKLLHKVSLLQQQKQLIQRELLAQRLQTFKLKQQLQQISHTLKKQYQLSLQNVNKQLSTKIHQTNKLKSIQTKQKQQIYIQLKQLQKKYELLTSEMLTVDDMMAIATKVHKRHSHFVKK